MSEVSGIELEKDAAGNNSYVRIDLKKYGDMINPHIPQTTNDLSEDQKFSLVFFASYKS